MAEYFKEIYRNEDLEFTSAYILKDQEGNNHGIALNLDGENGDDSQFILEDRDVRKLYPTMIKYMEKKNV